MKKTYKLQDLDCANCARKMEDAIRKIDGVEDVSVNFLTQKLTLTCADDKFDQALALCVKACKKVEPDTKILL